MVAPIDAKTVIDVDGESFTLRLNFRSIAMSTALGVDLFSNDGFTSTLVNYALLCKALTINDHEGMSEEEALAIVVRYGGDKFGAVVVDLMERFGGKDDANTSAEGNAPKKRTARKQRKKPAS